MPRGVEADAPPPLLPAPLYQGAVNTWECDANGHLNVRFHLERAFTGLAHFAAALGLRGAFRADAGATLVPRELHVRFLKEAHPNGPLAMHGGVVAFGDNDATLCLDMRHFDGAPATTFRLQVAHAEPHELKPFAWSARSREAAKKLAAALPRHAAPRAIDLSRAPAKANLVLARDLGARRIGAHLVTPDQCDAFGRLRADHVFGRVSDSVPHLFAEWRREAAALGAPPTLSGAVVEARIVFRAWARAGDLVEVHSAAVELTPKLTRVVHWLIDPASGGAWASIEAVAINFDLATRKAVDLPADLIAARQAHVVAGMAV
ncbi:MAG TPA: thioesterase family protein [Caulobacterales bacterium]|nr:thioesterase family protein [Caulobacterales bacterium]